MIQASSAFLTANAKLQKQPIFLIQIAGYSRAFTNYATGISGQYDWIVNIDDHSITIHDLDGGADLGEFSFNIQDYQNLITADFPGFVFEGKAITCMTGFPGMSQSDYALLFTGKIDSIASDNNNKEYKFTCVDNKDVLTKVIFTTGTDGFPIDSAHTYSFTGHPLDILISILENQLGLAVTDFNVAKLQLYRDGIFAGVQFFFVLDSAPAAKDFIESQIMKPLGGYIWVNSKGQIDFTFFRRDNRYPVTGGCCIGCWTDSSGVIIGNPFLVSASLGNPLVIQAPPGAAFLSLGMNDPYYTDNIGQWNFNINGSSVTVSAQARPWNPGVNPTYPISTTGSISPTTFAVTPGTTYTITYTGGMTQIAVGWAFTDPLGIPGVGSDPSSPGAFSVSLVRPLAAPDIALTDDNLHDQVIPLAGQADLINTLTFRFDKVQSSGNYNSEITEEYDASISKYGQFGQQVIEADGVRSGYQGYFVAASTAQLIFLRYGMKNLQFEGVEAFWSCCVLEPGDLISLTSSYVPDRVNGVMGISGALFEVLDRTWQFELGIVQLKLLDASYLVQLGQYLIAPDGIPAFASGSSYQKGRYMYLANDSDQYSDGTAGHPLG